MFEDVAFEVQGGGEIAVDLGVGGGREEVYGWCHDGDVAVC